MAMPVRECEPLGVPDGGGLVGCCAREGSVADGGAEPARGCELLGIPVHVAELLGIGAPADVGEPLKDRAAELLGVELKVIGIKLDYH